MPSARRVLAAVWAIWAMPCLATTLQDALIQAYSSNPDLTGARARLRAVDESVGIAKAAGRPQLGSSSGFTQTFDDIGHFRNGGRALTASAGASYGLFAGGRVRNAVNAADARLIASRADLRAVEGDVFTQVVSAYMNVIRDAAVRELDRNNLTLLETNFGANKERFKAGDLTRTDVAQSEARLANARSELVSAEGALTTSREDYRRIVGVWPVALESPPPLPTLPATPDDAVDIALASSPDLQSIAASAKAAQYDVDTARAQRLPVVSLSATANYTNYLNTLDKVVGAVSNRGLDQVQTDKIVGVSASIPLYQGGGPAAQVRQAKALENVVEEQQVGLERAVIADVRALFSGYAVATATIRASETAISANALAVEGAREEQSAGSRTILEVLNAQQELLNSRVALFVALRDQYVAGFTLLNAMGRVSLEALNLDGGALYDPLPNYRRASHSLSDWNEGKAPAPLATRTTGPTPVDQLAVAPMPAFTAPLPPTESETITRPSLDASPPRGLR